MYHFRVAVHSIIIPKINSEWLHVSIYEYAQKPTGRVNGHINVLNARTDIFDYVFFADCDQHPTTAACIAKLVQHFPGVKLDRLYIVCREIESWYLAGLTVARLNQLKIRFTGYSTDDVFKPEFDAMLPKVAGIPRIVHMISILAHYSVTEARARNTSFKCFTNFSSAFT